MVKMSSIIWLRFVFSRIKVCSDGLITVEYERIFTLIFSLNIECAVFRE